MGSDQRKLVLGVMSLMLWALIVVVTLKYVLLIMRADNNGEGGTLTLRALLQRVMGHNVFVVTLLGMAGAALFYGGAIITPAISVLSAVEGLKLALLRASIARHQLSRRALRPAPQSPMPRWQDKLFIWLARSANDASPYFKIPSGRAVEVGTQITV